MQLIGSQASPYVRRIRIQLGSRNYEFTKVNVFDSEGQKLLRQFSPTGRVPILVDGETVVWDSLLIAEYLEKETIDLDIKKELVLINEMSDAGIQLFQLRKFETDPKDEGAFSINNLARIKNILEYFENHLPDEWNLTSQWLFCTLEWFSFRNVYSWKTDYRNLAQFVESNQDRPFISETAPK